MRRQVKKYHNFNCRKAHKKQQVKIKLKILLQLSLRVFEYVTFQFGKEKDLQSVRFSTELAFFQMCVKCMLLTAVLRPPHLTCLWLVCGHGAFKDSWKMLPECPTHSSTSESDKPLFSESVTAE